MERLRIGLIGWGTVGSAFGRLVLDGPLPLRLASVAVRNRERDDLPKDVPVVAPEEALDADIVVELAGGTDGPREWARAALDRGTPYVTANKALLATHGGELAELAEKRSAALLASASVGGGTPMIETVAHLAATGEIVRLRGLVNATTTFILSAMGREQHHGAICHVCRGTFAPRPKLIKLFDQIESHALRTRRCRFRFPNELGQRCTLGMLNQIIH